jgi:hypothetical protein
MTIKVGTASWTDPTLTKSKRFYPPGCSNAEARLRFYASQFPIVEVDSSCYAMPSAPNSVLWAERTPAGFTFNITRRSGFLPATRPALTCFRRQPALPQNGRKNLYYRDVPDDIQSRIVATVR